MPNKLDWKRMYSSVTNNLPIKQIKIKRIEWKWERRERELGSCEREKNREEEEREKKENKREREEKIGEIDWLGFDWLTINKRKKLKRNRINLLNKSFSFSFFFFFVFLYLDQVYLPQVHTHKELNK